MNVVLWAIIYKQTASSRIDPRSCLVPDQSVGQLVFSREPVIFFGRGVSSLYDVSVY